MAILARLICAGVRERNAFIQSEVTLLGHPWVDRAIIGVFSSAIKDKWKAASRIHDPRIKPSIWCRSVLSTVPDVTVWGAVSSLTHVTILPTVVLAGLGS